MSTPLDKSSKVARAQTGNKRQRYLAIAILVPAAIVMAWMGGKILDYLQVSLPLYSEAIARYGGWTLGMIIGGAVVIPLVRIWGVFDRK